MLHEENELPSIEPHVMDTRLTQQDSKNFKGLLKEKADKQKVLLIYNTTAKDNGFLSEVMYDDRWYSPDISPQKKRKDAEQKAAQFALDVLNRY